MCNIRSYRYNCGHYDNRTLSQCRGTFATPKKSNKPLCVASDAELTVKVDETCRQCQYDTFCSDWETRIAKAQARQFAATQLLLQSRISKSGVEYGWAEEPTFDNAMLCGDDFGDDKGALEERELAAKEVSRLQTEFYQQQWSIWSSFMHQPLRQLEPRRSKAKKKGRSPLQNTISPEDFGPDEFVDTSLERVGSDGPGDSSSDEGALSDRSNSFDDLWEDRTIYTGWGNSLDFEQPPQPEPEVMLPDYSW